MVIDTNIFIEFLRAKDKTNTILFNLFDYKNLSISTITVFELYAGAGNEAKWKDLKILLENISIIPVDEEIAKQAAKIYQNLKSENKLIEFRDILIAATAIVNDLELITINEKHFSRIENLNIKKINKYN